MGVGVCRVGELAAGAHAGRGPGAPPPRRGAARRAPVRARRPVRPARLRRPLALRHQSVPTTPASTHTIASSIPLVTTYYSKIHRD